MAALVTVVIGGAFLILAEAGIFGLGPNGVGRGMFGTLTWICLAAALATGLFLTSDCVSEEKRDGTLGLLFLTDLRGYDVVSGKLLASSLRGFYALLAVLPVLGLPLLLEGSAPSRFGGHASRW